MAWYMGRTQEMLRKKCLMTSALLSSTVSVLTLATDSTGPPSTHTQLRPWPSRPGTAAGVLRGGLCRGKGSSHPAGSKVSEVTQGPGSNPLSSAGLGAPPAQANLNFPPVGVPCPLFPRLLPRAGWPRPL